MANTINSDGNTHRHVVVYSKMGNDGVVEEVTKYFGCYGDPAVAKASATRWLNQSGRSISVLRRWTEVSAAWRAV